MQINAGPRPLASSSGRAAPSGAVHAAAAAWFVVLAVLVSYPLIASIDTAVPGAGAGDNLAFLWNSWWARHLSAGRAWSDYFHTTFLFAPMGAPLVLNTHIALESFTAAALPGVPIVRAHNLVLLAGLAANGFATYRLAFWFGRRAWPSIVAGTAFATCSFLAVHLLGHVNLTHAWVLPLAVLAWIAFVAAPTAARAVGVALALAAVAWSDYYYLVYVGLFSMVWLAVTAWNVEPDWPVTRHRGLERAFAIVAGIAAAAAAGIWLTGGFAVDLGGLHVTAQRARNPASVAGVCLLVWTAVRTRISATRNPDLPSSRALVTHGSLALVLFAVLISPLAAAAIGLVRSGGYVSQPYFWRSGPRGVDVATVFLGPPMHPVTGPFTSDIDQQLGIDRIEQTGWLGIVSIALLISAVTARAALGRDAHRWLWICAVFAVWSLGPSLSIGGIDTGVFLPQALVRYAPILSNARMPGRAIVVVQLASAVLGALVLTRWNWGRAPMILLTAAIVLEGLTAPFPLYRLPQSDAIDSRLAGASGAVVELPSGVRDGFGEWGRFDARALVHQMTHGRPLAGGFSARLSPSVTKAYHDDRALSALFDLSSKRIGPDALPADLGPLLARSGIFHVVVNTDSLGSDVRAAFERRGLRLVAEEGTRKLYAVDQ
jgi:hypothetical protein